MKAPAFEYLRAESLDEVFEAFDGFGEEAQILAGGQSLMPTLNMRLSHPRLLIDINRLEELAGIEDDGKTIRIGALTRHAEVELSATIETRLPLIARAIEHVAHPAIRSRGTFGGSVALADPAAEMPACLLAYDGSVVVQGPGGRRSIAARDYFRGLYETAREPDEVLIETRIAAPEAGEQSFFIEFARRHGDFAIVGIAGRATIEDRAIRALRIVVFGSEPAPTHASKAAEVATGAPLDGLPHEAIAEALSAELDPMEDPQGSRDFKLHLARTLLRRALDTLGDCP
jgi:carbon-monoxide dehydrogenase medium subunit